MSALPNADDVVVFSVDDENGSGGKVDSTLKAPLGNVVSGFGGAASASVFDQFGHADTLATSQLFWNAL